ncbi:PAN domain protein, partial [Ostertagia ostertagi]
MRVCSRKRYVFTSTAVLQRVHLPTPERCVERCVENMSFCKAAVYTPYKDTSIGVCTLFSENSVQQPTALHPDASVEPVSTVHELLESCPQFSLPEITYKISSNHRRKLESSLERIALDEELRSDAFFPDQFVEDSDRQTSDRYA